MSTTVVVNKELLLQYLKATFRCVNDDTLFDVFYHLVTAESGDSQCYEQNNFSESTMFQNKGVEVCDLPNNKSIPAIKLIRDLSRSSIAKSKQLMDKIRMSPLGDSTGLSVYFSPQESEAAYIAASDIPKFFLGMHAIGCEVSLYELSPTR